MRRGGFLKAAAGAALVATLPIPKLPGVFDGPYGFGIPELLEQLPSMLAYSEAMARDLICWNAMYEVYAR